MNTREFEIPLSLFEGSFKSKGLERDARLRLYASAFEAGRQSMHREVMEECVTTAHLDFTSSELYERLKGLGNDNS